MIFFVSKISTMKTVSKYQIYSRKYDIFQRMGRQNYMIPTQNEITLNYT